MIAGCAIALIGFGLAVTAMVVAIELCDWLLALPTPVHPVIVVGLVTGLAVVSLVAVGKALAR